MARGGGEVAERWREVAERWREVAERKVEVQLRKHKCSSFTAEVCWTRNKRSRAEDWARFENVVGKV